MMILKYAIFILLSLEHLKCWPAISSTKTFLARFNVYQDSGVQPRTVRNSFENLYNEAIKDIGYIYADLMYVDRIEATTLTSESIENISLEYFTSNGRVDGECTKEPSGDKKKTFTCKSLATRLAFSIPEEIKLEKLEIFGYGSKFSYFVGCFKDKHIHNIRPLPNTEDCFMFCSKANKFYGYNFHQQCICIMMLPKTHVEYATCVQCPERPYIFCGSEGYTAVYSTAKIQELATLDVTHRCVGMDSSIACSSCASGLVGQFCEAISCDVNNGNCQERACGSISSFLKEKGFQHCMCREGQTLDGIKCLDVDECAFDEFCEIYNGNCTNLNATYLCSCGVGFIQLNERLCEDIDECQNETSCNEDNSDCANKFGHYDCICKPGYRKLRGAPLKMSCKAVEKVSEFSLFMFFLLLLIIAVAAAVYYFFVFKN